LVARLDVRDSKGTRSGIGERDVLRGRAAVARRLALKNQRAWLHAGRCRLRRGRLWNGAGTSGGTAAACDQKTADDDSAARKNRSEKFHDFT